jgi:hypothetical protein
MPVNTLDGTANQPQWATLPTKHKTKKASHQSISKTAERMFPVHRVRKPAGELQFCESVKWFQP